MKRILPLLFTILFLLGCGGERPSQETATELRQRLHKADSCQFIASISADYGKEVYGFQMRCICDHSGNITFEVLSPETIKGITGRLSGEGGALTFDEHALIFSLMADERLSPVSGPWIMMRALRSGYIRACGKSDNATIIYLDDSYEADAYELKICINKENVPESAEIFYRNNRLLMIRVENFTIL